MPTLFYENEFRPARCFDLSCEGELREANQHQILTSLFHQFRFPDIRRHRIRIGEAKQKHGYQGIDMSKVLRKISMGA